MATQSSTANDLYLLDSFQDYLDETLKALECARRTAIIFSDRLDPLIYDRPDVLDAISTLARKNRNSEIRILVRHTKPLVELGHALLKLSQRLPSKILIRKLTTEPTHEDRAFLICDNDRLIYKHDDRSYQGFANYHAQQEIKSLKEAFLPCWEQGVIETDLRQLNL